ncbi:hypothetical protein ACFX13_027732 [Malus domestica]
MPADYFSASLNGQNEASHHNYNRLNRLSPVFFDSDFTDIATELLHNLCGFESLMFPSLIRWRFSSRSESYEG